MLFFILEILSYLPSKIYIETYKKTFENVESLKYSP